jgi:hypothetical protein
MKIEAFTVELAYGREVLGFYETDEFWKMIDLYEPLVLNCDSDGCIQFNSYDEIVSPVLKEDDRERILKVFKDQSFEKEFPIGKKKYTDHIYG